MLFLKIVNGATVNANFFGPGGGDQNIDINTTHYIPMEDIAGFRSNNNSTRIDWFYYKPHGAGDTDGIEHGTTRWGVGSTNNATTFLSAEIVDMDTVVQKLRVRSPGRFSEETVVE